MAYEAESTLEKVLARVPDSVFDHDTEVLVIDDSSGDRTFDVGVRSARDSRHRITVLYNPENQGYGGNQKLGYQYAIRHGFDVVVLLHGDGQYAPEAIPSLLAPMLDGSADAVMGSRMLVPGVARQGGMPLYKFVGNKILTFLQNRLLGSRLSEFHSGFRAYRVAALAKIPFGYNSNVFHFDTEIIIQLMLAGCRITEVPIPTYYGDEICRVDGLRYAKDVVADHRRQPAAPAEHLLRPQVRHRRRDQHALRPEARVPLVAHGRARGGAARRARARHRLRPRHLRRAPGGERLSRDRGGPVPARRAARPSKTSCCGTSASRFPTSTCGSSTTCCCSTSSST